MKRTNLLALLICLLGISLLLPSIDEVDMIYHNLHLKGHSNFLENIRSYQSSTEHDANNFVLRLFWRDTIVNISKISGDDIRPSRVF